MKRPASGWGKALLKLAAILLAGIVAGFALLMAAYALPIGPIAEHVRLSVQSLDGSWETGEISYEQLVKGYQTAQLDNTTDASMLLAAALESDLPVAAQALNSSSAVYHGYPYYALLEYGVNGQANLTVTTAARYWHGFLVYLKPLLLFFSYMDIRVLQMIFQLLLLCAVVTALCRRGLSRYVPAFALSLLAVTPAVTGFSLQFSTVYTLFLLAMLLPLCRPRVLKTRFRTAAFFLVVGMATCYFDYLTYPIAAFGMPFAVSLLLSPPRGRREALGRFLLCLAAWGAGYFGMWAGKWALVCIWGNDPQFIAGLIAKVTERAGYASRGAALTVKDVLGRVFGVFAKKAYLLAALAALAVYAALVIRALVRRTRTLPAGARRCAESAGESLALAVTGLTPVCWYLLASNHSYNHAFFTSRALVVTVFAACALGTNLLRRLQGARDYQKSG